MSTQKVLILEIEESDVEKYSAWTDVIAFRFVPVDADHVRFEVTNSLERVTRPEAE